MKNSIRGLAAVAIWLFGIGCSTGPKRVEILEDVSMPVPLISDFPAIGWRMFPAPTTAGAPGEVFAQTTNMAIPVANLGLAVTNHLADLPSAVVDCSSEANLKFYLNWLGLAAPPNVSAQYLNGFTIRITYVGVEQEVAFSLMNRSTIKVNTPELLKADELVPPGVPVNVIISAYKAREVHYSIKREKLIALGGEADFLKSVQGTASIVRTNGAEILVESKYSVPHRVFYLPRVLGESRASVTGGGVEIALQETASHALDPRYFNFYTNAHTANGLSR